jgi:hypothetical protein
VNEASEVTGKPEVQRLLERVQDDGGVLAVMLFGSHARGEAGLASDIDLAIVLLPEKDTAEERMRVRLKFLPSKRMDVRIFQQLPLYVRKRVLEDGVILFCRDLDKLYELAYRTARAFAAFRPHYRQYLEQVARAGP